MLPSALSTASASQLAGFRSCIFTACFLAAYASPLTSHPVNGNTRFQPVCSTVAGRDLHPLDSIKKFHRLIFGSFPRQCRDLTRGRPRSSPPGGRHRLPFCVAHL